MLINCWNNAKIDPELIDYIECHGTGTNLGDPIETAGIQNAFEKYTEKKQFCGIGSVKSSIGHLDAVSGAASLLKVVLAIAIATQVSKVAGIWTGLACCIGHCYPVFAKFHGGKAVSTMFGFLFSTSIFLFQDASYLLVPFGMFLVVLYLFKYVSLDSMCEAIASSLYITALMLGFNVESISVIVASWLMTVLVIYRHRTNIEKIKKGTENTISWL